MVADEVVFGTFLTKAGPITAVNVEAKEITINDLGTQKPLVIKLTEDSQIKKMPDFEGATGGGPPAGAMVMRGGGPPNGMPGGPPDLAQMLDRMPAARLEDLKAGESIVVSSTKGATAGQITAIMLVANADMLIRMASMQSGARGGRSGAGAGGPSMGMGGMGGGFGGLDIPGMMP